MGFFLFNIPITGVHTPELLKGIVRVITFAEHYTDTITKEGKGVPSGTPFLFP